jgi:anthranilate phosphoribosyltransferase
MSISEQIENSDKIRNQLREVLEGTETKQGLLALVFVMAQTIVATTDAKNLKNNTKMVTNMVDATVELLAELEEIADDTITKH